jgi:hypothetical protein
MSPALLYARKDAKATSVVASTPPSALSGTDAKRHGPRMPSTTLRRTWAGPTPWQPEIAGRLRGEQKLLGTIAGVMFPPKSASCLFGLASGLLPMLQDARN